MKFSARLIFASVFAAALLLTSPPAFAAGDGDSGGGFLEGFEDTAPEVGSQSAPEEKGFWSRFRLSGDVILTTAYDWAHDDPVPGGGDFDGISMLRPEALVQLDAEIYKSWKARVSGRFWHDFAYDINDREDYQKGFLDDIENRSELWETWIKGTLFPGLDISSGRQIVVWGTSENLRVTDVINPMDLRELGMTDIEQLRLPVWLTRLDYTVDRFTLSGMAIHEFREDWLPMYGSPYAPYPYPLPPDDPPSNSIDNTQWAASASGRFTGWDLHLYFADYYDHNPHFVEKTPAQVVFLGFPFPPVVIPPTYERKYAELTMGGAAATVALGNWLLKAEGSYTDGYKFMALPDRDFAKVSALGGVEYSGFNETTITLEASYLRVLDWEPALEQSLEGPHKSETYWVARFTRDFLHDRAQVVVLGTAAGDFGDDGWFVRTQGSYDWTDNFKTTLGVVFYGSGEWETFETLDNNDRVFLELKYSF